MNRHVCSNVFLLLCFLFLLTNCFVMEVESRGCKPKGQLSGNDPPPGECNTEDSSGCCSKGNLYDIYDCSPPVSNHTKANLTLKSFDHGGNGGGPSYCDNNYHSDDEYVVELSTGWFANGTRCNKYIHIRGNGKSVAAKVVDECDSLVGCDGEHNYEPPCGNNVVKASKGVWVALGVPLSQIGSMKVHWSEL